MKNQMALTGILASLLFGCQKPDPSFNLAANNETFSVAPDVIEIPQKIDILWVIDNSGSMATSQNQLAESFPQFINNFTKKRYDFQMGVTTTDAYRGRFAPGEVWKRTLRKSSDNELFLSPLTMDVGTKFINMVKVGINGHGDERAFQSLEDVLNEPNNQSFNRDDAYLAVIIVSDEDDFSNPTTAFLDSQYNHANLIPVSYYHDVLKQVKGDENFSVHSISILDESCRTSLNNTFTERKVAHRYHSLVNLSGGHNASLCEDFGNSLSLIADTIIEKKPPQTSYKLNKEPIADQIQVIVNGQTIPKDSVNGWSYDSLTWTITLHGQTALLISNGGSISILAPPKNPFEN